LAETITFCLPRLGGWELDGRVIAWRKSEGEAFRAGDVLLEVETDKAIVEVPAGYEGVIKQQLVQIDQMIEFDQPLAMVDVEITVSQKHSADFKNTILKADSSASGEMSTRGHESVSDTRIASPENNAGLFAGQRSDSQMVRPRASPAARNYARAKGVNLPTIGSGVGGRIVLRDVERIGVSSHVESQQIAATVIAEERMVPTTFGEVFMRSVNISESRPSTTIVLLHGIFGNIDTWAAILSRLSSVGQAVAAFDLPAHGRSPLLGVGLADVVTAFTEAISRLPGGPKVLVGHSLGGAIVSSVASRMPKGTVSSVVLISPAGLGTEINQGFIDGLLNSGSEVVVRRELEKLANKLPVINDDFLASLMSKIRAGEKDLRIMAKELCQDGVQQIDIRRVLEDLQVPVTIFWGRQDQIIPWQHALNAPAKVALHLIADVGHMPQWECQGLISDKLLQAALN
jgi:pyruvate dehydrogenase E2 component (dihydrolipoamide acetyltransferase)